MPVALWLFGLVCLFIGFLGLPAMAAGVFNLADGGEDQQEQP
jgi:hypothetical protein